MDVQSVQKVLPEVREIRSRNLSEGTAEYHVLKVHAAERFRNSVSGVARRLGFDLVMDRGSIALKPGVTDVEIVDITAHVLAELSR